MFVCEESRILAMVLEEEGGKKKRLKRRRISSQEMRVHPLSTARALDGSWSSMLGLLGLVSSKIT